MEKGMAGNQLEELRCVLHAHREAVAQCPSCSRFYCRECVVEHSGKMLCKSCLDASVDADMPESGNAISGWVVGFASLCISFLITCAFFYIGGKVLLSIPEDFHAGPTDYIVDSIDE